MRKTTNILLILIALLHTSHLNGQDQVNEEQIKASILYYLCDYIEWPQERKSDEFRIGVLGADPVFIRELNLIADNEKNIRGKPISIEVFDNEQFLTDNLHVLVLGPQFYNQVTEIQQFCQEHSILMVTDELNDRIHSVINFYYNQDKEAVNFEVNKQNLILARFNYRDDILLYGGSLIDVRELYQATQKMLEEESVKAALLENLIIEKDKELSEKNGLIEGLNANIESSKVILQHLTDSVNVISNLMRDQKAELELKLVEFEKLTNEYNSMMARMTEQQERLNNQEARLEQQARMVASQELQISEKELQLDSLDREINNKEITIRDQSEILTSQENTIQRKNTAILLVVILVALVSVIGLLTLRAYNTKQRYNKLLEESNKKLQDSNEELSTKSDIINNQNVELKETLKNLTEAQSQLLQSEKMASLGILTAGVAHEINNPLNYIMGSYQGLKKYFSKAGSLDERTTDILLNSLKTGLDRATNIVQGLNQFSRDSQKYDEICEVHSIIDNCIAMLNNQYKNRIEVVKKYGKVSDIIPGNVGKLHQVFLNVLTNSSQAIEGDGTVIIETFKKNGKFQIRIEDNGSGIPKKDLPRITDPFFTTKDPGEGTGLGLSITYNILQDHNGDINFESEIGKGTSVLISLPVK